jgi:chorismate mutase
MSFKNQFIKSRERIEEMFETLFEASEESYNLTTKGLTQIFDKSFEEPPTISKTENFIVYNPSNETDKKEIQKLKNSDKSVRVVMYTMSKSRIVKPNISSEYFNVSKEFLSNTKAIEDVQKDLLKTISEREAKRKAAGKTKQETSVKILDTEIITFLDMLRNNEPTKFAKGVYYVLNQTSGDFFEIIYNKKDDKFSFDSLFEISAPYEGPSPNGEKFKISAYAQEINDIMALGVYFDANEMSSAIKSFQKDNKDLDIPYQDSSFKSIVTPFEKALNASDDFRRFNEVVKRDYKKFGYDDWYGVCILAGGMSQFVREQVSIKSPYIVLDSISEFKDLEAKKMSYKTDEEYDDAYGKVSTVEVVISSVPAKDLLKFISRKDTMFDPEEAYVKIVDIDRKELARFWQISLKTTEASSLGKSQRYFSKIYGMIVNSKEVFESYKEFPELLSEGLLQKLSDTAKKGVKFLEFVGKKFYDKIKFLITAMKDWSNSLRNNLSKNVSRNVVDDASELYGKGLTEDVKKEINEIIVELMNDSAKYWRVGNEKIEKFIPEMNRNKNENIFINFKPTTFQQPTENTFKKQIFTYSFLKAFQQVVINSKNPLEKYIDELLGLYIEAVFGATRLPLWKVYSAGSKPPYEFVGTKYTTMEERKGNILKGLGKDGMKIVSLDVTPLKGSHKISVTILSNIISENGQFKPSYVYYDVSYDPNTLSPVFIAVREFSLEDSKEAS